MNNIHPYSNFKSNRKLRKFSRIFNNKFNNISIISKIES